LCALLAERLDVPTAQARVRAGLKNRLKQVAILGDPAALLAKLRKLAPIRDNADVSGGRPLRLKRKSASMA
jgi:hypothetical protein